MKTLFIFLPIRDYIKTRRKLWRQYLIPLATGIIVFYPDFYIIRNIGGSSRKQHEFIWQTILIYCKSKRRYCFCFFKRSQEIGSKKHGSFEASTDLIKMKNFISVGRLSTTDEVDSYDFFKKAQDVRYKLSLILPKGQIHLRNTFHHAQQNMH